MGPKNGIIYIARPFINLNYNKMDNQNPNMQNPAPQGAPQNPTPQAPPTYYTAPPAQGNYPPPPVQYPQQQPQHQTQNNSNYGVTYYDQYGNPVFLPFGQNPPVAQAPVGVTKSGNTVYFAPAQDDWTDYLSKVLAGAVLMGSVQWAMEKIKSI